ncbi:MAG: hypothetical protein RIB41_08545 [Oceanibaculum nanhaiense]|jgi:hypothetical protein|uniref:hypothetical protein n=1 Tax=Oceanibaculum nanhaiense TaxID=1909734 RepID=UPI0032EFA160
MLPRGQQPLEDRHVERVDGGLTARGLQLPTDCFAPVADYETTKWRLFGTGD